MGGARAVTRHRASLAGFAIVATFGSAGSGSTDGNGPGSPPLALRLETPGEVRSGARVHLTLKVKNTGKATLEQPLGGQPPYDFVVTRTDGTELWRWSKGRVVRDVLELKTLRPGQELAFEADWDQRDLAGRLLPPGTYLLRGVLRTDPPERLETKPKPLVIGP
jgi:hypothetical protein